MDFCRNWNVKEEVWFYKCSLFGIRNSFVCKFVLMDNVNTPYCVDRNHLFGLNPCFNG